MPLLANARQIRILQIGYNGINNYYSTACSASEIPPSWESSTGYPQPLTWLSNIPQEFGGLNQSESAFTDGSTDQGTASNSQTEFSWMNSGKISRVKLSDIISCSDIDTPRSNARNDPDQKSDTTRISCKSFLNNSLSQELEQHSNLLPSAFTPQISEGEKPAHFERGKRQSSVLTTTSTASVQISEMKGSLAAQTEIRASSTIAESSGFLSSETFSLFLNEIIDLLEIFFFNYHLFLLCIHHKIYLNRVKFDTEIAKSSPLFWALFSVAASRHSQAYLRCLQHDFLARARTIFDSQFSQSTCSIQTLQAAVWVVFQTYTSEDLTEAWLFLGKACRLAALLRLNRIDTNREKLSFPASRSRNEIEKEEQRKTMWTLFLLDRLLSCFVEFPLAIDERQFQMNFPIDDNIFQDADCSVSLLTA